jgi:putative ABC transport system permease protein
MNPMILLFRNLTRYRRYTIPSVVGLGVAIAAMVTIFQFISFELSYDQYYQNDLCRVIATKYQGDTKMQSSTVTYSAVGPALVADHQEIVNQTRIFPFGNAIVHKGEESANIQRCVAVEPSFFEMFEMEFLAGSSAFLFDRPEQIILTESTARKVFGGDADFHQLINMTVKLDNDPEQYTLVGVVKDFPANSHLSYNLFISYTTISNTWGLNQARYDWQMVDFRHYVQLREGTDLARLNRDLESFGLDYLGYSSGDYERFELERVKDIYLSQHILAYDVARHGDRHTIMILFSLGCVLFIVSWINFINLNSALAIEKSKDMGIRKVLGIARGGLWRLLAMDVWVVYGLAILLGAGLSLLFTLWMKLAGFDIKSIDQLIVDQYLHYPLLVGLAGLLLAGAVLGMVSYYRMATRISPIQALRARAGQQVTGSVWVSRGLLTLQFVLSMVAFSAGLIVYDQQHYINSAPVGFESDNLWVIQQPKLTSSDATFSTRLQTFKTDLLVHPGITNVTSNQRTPGQQLQVEYGAKIGHEEIAMSYLYADQDYLGTYGINLLAGRDFHSGDIKTSLGEVRHVIINKRALKTLGLEQPAAAPGQVIELFGTDRQVIGVVDDYRQESLIHDFQPTVLIPMIHSNNQIVIQAEGAPAEWLSYVKGQYASMFPGNSFEYKHLKSEYQQQYASVYSVSKSLNLFTLLTVVVSLFGMISLAALNLLSRIREISIRKILGASYLLIYKGVLKVYLLIFLLASVIAIPLIILFANGWLQQFTSRIVPGAYHLALPMSIMIITIVAVLLLISRKVIHSNPVEVLRAE